MDAMQILVIILSIFLAIFLVLAIALTIMLIKVTRDIKKVTSSAQSATEKVGNLADTINKAASPALVTKLLSEYAAKLKKSHSKKKEDK